MLRCLLYPQGQNVLLLLGDAGTRGHIWSAVSTSCWQGLKHPRRRDIVYSMKQSIDLMSLRFRGAAELLGAWFYWRRGLWLERSRHRFCLKAIWWQQESRERYHWRRLQRGDFIKLALTCRVWGCTVSSSFPRSRSLLGPECGNDIHLVAGQQSHSLSYVTAHLLQ